MGDIIFQAIEAENPTCAICEKPITIYNLGGDFWAVSDGVNHYHEDCLDRLRPGWRWEADRQ